MLVRVLVLLQVLVLMQVLVRVLMPVLMLMSERAMRVWMNAASAGQYLYWCRVIRLVQVLSADERRKCCRVVQAMRVLLSTTSSGLQR